MTLRASLAALALLIPACASDGDGGGDGAPAGAQGFLDLEMNVVAVAPVRDAIWDVTVTSGGADVWDVRLTSGEFGDGKGLALYVGTCVEGPTTLRAALAGLYSARVGDVGGAKPGDPIPANAIALLGEPVAEATFTCVADQDRFQAVGIVPAVSQTLGEGRPGVRVGPSVCEVNWACDDDGPALDVSCSAPETPPVVLMDDLVVHCDDGGEDVVIDPTTAGPPEEVLNQTLWRVPVAVDAERAAAATCTVTTRLTPGVPAGEEGRFGVRIADRAIVAPTVYPLVTLSAVVADHGPSCQAELVGDPDSGALRVVYTAAGAAADTVLDHASR
ncbi:MAG: hypothetical protein H6745_04560 [Deltaproteobacteria bacterium]|nr:hypothetical protein [Deltaproteobacteria bacterium]